MSARSKPINLLPLGEFDVSFWGKALKWALSTGRYIVIITEIVVIGAFLSRFKLDKDISDLSEHITGQKAHLDALANTEKKFLGLQTRLATASAILATEKPYAALINDFLLANPNENVSFTTINLVSDTLTLTGSTPSQENLVKLVDWCKNHPLYKSLNLTVLNSQSVPNTSGPNLTTFNFTLAGKI
jgi:hypothetical protein